MRKGLQFNTKMLAHKFECQEPRGHVMRIVQQFSVLKMMRSRLQTVTGRVVLVCMQDHNAKKVLRSSIPAQIECSWTRWKALSKPLPNLKPREERGCVDASTGMPLTCKAVRNKPCIKTRIRQSRALQIVKCNDLKCCVQQIGKSFPSSQRTHQTVQYGQRSSDRSSFRLRMHMHLNLCQSISRVRV